MKQAMYLGGSSFDILLSIKTSPVRSEDYTDTFRTFAIQNISGNTNIEFLIFLLLS